MKRIIILMMIAVGLISCGKNDVLKEFDCKSKSNIGSIKESRDILKKFKIDLPVSWKKQLYYDQYKSQIYAADTTKQLTETYILDIAWHQGELYFDDSFEQKINDTLRINEKLVPVKSGFGKFHKKDMYWNLSTGLYNNYPYNYLQVYIKFEIDEYFLLTTKVYGDQNVDERLCESLMVTDKIKFIE